MTTVTWPARRAGADRDILLCGRRNPGGRYICRGEIAYFTYGDGLWTTGGGDAVGGFWIFPPGLIAERDEDGVIYRETTRWRPGHPRWRRRQRKPLHLDGAHPGPIEREGGRGHDLWQAIDRQLPVRRLCPTCRTLALITRDLVGS